MKKKEKLIIITAGGTGGHIIPGLNVAKALKDRGWKIIWVGNSKNMEGYLVPENNIIFHSIDSISLKRSKKNLIWLLKFIFILFKSFFISFKLILKYKPDIVLGFGGYTSFPCSFMAKIMRYKVILHEQNIFPGLANRILSKFVDYKISGFPDVFEGTNYFGNPVDNKMLLIDDPLLRYVNQTGPLKILVIGGSLGAKFLNDLIPETISLIPISKRPVITHQSGTLNLESLRFNYIKYNVKATCIPFIENMAHEMSKNDLIICRAGGMTIAEICVVGIAALFIPFPYATDNHQYKNANFLVQNKAAWAKNEKDITPSSLASWLKKINRQTLRRIAIESKKYGKPNATINIADFCDTIIIDKNS